MNAVPGRRLGELLASLRNRAGMTQEELAAASGLSVRAVSDLERDRVARPRRRSLELLAAALSLDPAQARALNAIARGVPVPWPQEPAGEAPGAPGHAAARAVPHQLPAMTAGFAGRSAELGTLGKWLGGADGAGAPGTVVTIAGAAGVGKTALAVRWGHQVADRFPDGQIWLNLRGFTPAAAPLSPAEAIRAMLDALRVPPEQIPVSPDAQAGLYRTLVTGTRVLIVLDNARDAGQVRPLLPGSPGCLVLITSRSKLLGLAATEGSHLLNLDVLAASEARQVLAGRLGHERLAAEPEAAGEVLRVCAGLPLALGIAAARVAASPGMRLTDLAGHLRDAQTRLDVLDGGEPASSLRAIFLSSCQQLPPDAARMFRLLGLHPGPDISLAAACSLAGAPQRRASEALHLLTGAHLLTEHLPGRFTFHDLLRAYAREQAEQSETRASRNAALGRVLDHYLHTAHTAALLLQPTRQPLTLTPARRGVTPERPAAYAGALAWFDAEHQVLLAVTTLAAGTGFGVHAWQIPWALADFLDRRGHWHDKASIQRTALAAATDHGDVAGQAESGRLLALACSRLGDHDQAHAHLLVCVKLYQELGDRAGEANSRHTLGWLAVSQGRYADGLGHAEQALRLFRAIGYWAGQAEMLNAIGWCHTELGDYQQARSFCQQAIALHREAGDRYREAHAWDSLGYAEHHLGDFAQAAESYQQALSFFRELGDRFYEATILTHLGDTHLAAGEPQQAREAWQQALAILDGLHHPDASGVRAKLAGTGKDSSLAPAASSAPAGARPT